MWSQWCTVSAQRIVGVNSRATNALIDNGGNRCPAGLARFLWQGIAETGGVVVEATGVEEAESVTTGRLK